MEPTRSRFHPAVERKPSSGERSVVATSFVPITSAEQLKGAFEDAAKAPVEAVAVMGASVASAELKLIPDLAAKHRPSDQMSSIGPQGHSISSAEIALRLQARRMYGKNLVSSSARVPAATLLWIFEIETVAQQLHSPLFTTVKTMFLLGTN